MKTLNHFKSPIKFLLTDIDDTLTDDGLLGPEAYSALWELHSHGIKVIPVTGRPAGWCELIARQWPVDGVIGENGAFYFRYSDKKMNRHFAKIEMPLQKTNEEYSQYSLSPSSINKENLSLSKKPPQFPSSAPLNKPSLEKQFSNSLEKTELKTDDPSQEKLLKSDVQFHLTKIKNEILKEVPGAAVASDQFCRLYDLAIDFCEDVPPLNPSEVDKIVKIFKNHGAQAKVSSIHVNGWFGKHNKVFMAKEFLSKEFNLSIDEMKVQCAFSGDSPNDEPMFEFFPHSFAVANFENFKNQVEHLPAYISNSRGGKGFAEICKQILHSQN